MPNQVQPHSFGQRFIVTSKTLLRSVHWTSIIPAGSAYCSKIGECFFPRDRLLELEDWSNHESSSSATFCRKCIVWTSLLSRTLEQWRRIRNSFFVIPLTRWRLSVTRERSQESIWEWCCSPGTLLASFRTCLQWMRMWALLVVRLRMFQCLNLQRFIQSFPRISIDWRPLLHKAPIVTLLHRRRSWYSIAWNNGSLEMCLLLSFSWCIVWKRQISTMKAQCIVYTFIGNWNMFTFCRHLLCS